MENNQYTDLIKRKQQITKQLAVLKKDKKVQEYLDLCNLYSTLTKEEKTLSKKLKSQEYSTCNHICCCSLVERDYQEGRTHRYYGCIKCGLNERILAKTANFTFSQIIKEHILNPDEEIMYNYLTSKSLSKKNIIPGNFELNRAIYLKINAKYPEIDDETALRYLKYALYKIQNISVNAKRKTSRALRLSLNPEFNKWD